LLVVLCAGIATAMMRLGVVLASLFFWFVFFGRAKKMSKIIKMVFSFSRLEKE